MVAISLHERIQNSIKNHTLSLSLKKSISEFHQTGGMKTFIPYLKIQCVFPPEVFAYHLTCLAVRHLLHELQKTYPCHDHWFNSRTTVVLAVKLNHFPPGIS